MFRSNSVPSDTLEMFTDLFNTSRQFRSLALSWASGRPANRRPPCLSRHWDKASMAVLISTFANLKFGYLFYVGHPSRYSHRKCVLRPRFNS